MGSLLSFQPKDQNPQLVLVLALSANDWDSAIRLLENSDTGYFASYYLVEQIETLSNAGLLAGYSACMLVGAEFLSVEDKKRIELLAEELPIIWLKQSDNVYDIALENSCSEVITPSELASLDIENKLDQGKRFYQTKKVDAQKAICLRYGDGGDIYQSAVAGVEAYDANNVVTDVVDSLRLIARTQGVSIDWLRCDNSYNVLLNQVETRRALMTLMLALFEFYEHVSLKISPSSILSDRCVWLDVSAGNQRKSGLVSDITPDLEDELMTLKNALNTNQGELFELERSARSMSIRLEWLAISDC